MVSGFVARHPLEDLLAAASPGGAGENHIAVPRTRAVWSVLAHGGSEAAVAAVLPAIAGASPRFCGPQEWLVVAGSDDRQSVEAALSRIAGISVVDQSDGRSILVLSGPDSRRLLAKCTAVDLHPSVFAIGQSANTLIGHAGANIVRVGDDVYEIAVARSLAVSVFEALKLLGREFGLTAGFAE